jgi:hypothetical protein
MNIDKSRPNLLILAQRGGAGGWAGTGCMQALGRGRQPSTNPFVPEARLLDLDPQTQILGVTKVH